MLDSWCPDFWPKSRDAIVLDHFVTRHWCGCRDKSQWTPGGIEPRAPRMASGCNTTSPFGLVHIMLRHDTVSERLRRWTRNPLGSARGGSNPLGVVCDPATCTRIGSFGKGGTGPHIKNDRTCKTAAPGVEPGLSQPQRDVLNHSATRPMCMATS